MSVSTTTVPRTGTFIPTLLALTTGLLVLGAIFWPECRAAVGVWIDSTAYGHCFLVIPIAAYLAWDRRDSLRGLIPCAAPVFALLGLPIALAWFAAERLGIMEGRQLAALAFMELLFLVVLGWRMFRALAAPLLYLVFLVPFGAFVTPVLQTFTAHFIDVGLTILGISHYSNDMLVEISGGTFYVAEACAGLRFLIAAVAFGVFYALLNYRSPGRRIAFIAASIIVPIIANGFRALGIVVLGNVLGSAEAAAADHIIYGWGFFSAVMLLLVAAGLPFREAPAGPRPRRGTDGSATHQPWAGLAVIVVAAIAPGAAMALDRNVATPALASIPAWPAPAGCTSTPAPNTAPDRALFQVQCGPRIWTVTIQAVPARSTGNRLADIRTRLSSPPGADDLSTAPLSGTPSGAGAWQAVISNDPSQVTAIATYIHGAPAAGGIRQRLVQARDSILGNDIPPLLIAITTEPPHRLNDRDRQVALAELAQIVTAQPDLDATVRRLTAPSSRPPPT